jgi:dTDP-glucose pyrophosphorylase
MLDLMKKENLFCVCGVYPQESLEAIRRTYSLIHGPDGQIYRLIEKPRKPFNPLMGTGNILFRYAIFNYVDFTPINLNRGEKELPDMIQCAIDDGEKIKLFQVCDHYINVNSVEEWSMVEDNWPAGSANRDTAGTGKRVLPLC